MSEEKSIYAQERELLHNQLELLAEQSKKCMPTELDKLAMVSEQMVSIYSALKL